MTTQDAFNIAATVFAIAATIAVIYRLYTMAKEQARDKAEHAARMQTYQLVNSHHAQTAQRFGGAATGLGIFNTPN